MISDFISVNELDARIISFPSDTPAERALKEARLSPAALSKSVVFVDEKMDFFVVVANSSEHVSVDDAEELFSIHGFEIPNEDEVLDLTGFEKRAFPPIGVFGMKVALHPSVKKQNTLLFELSPREFLVIKKEEILRAASLNESFF